MFNLWHLNTPSFFWGLQTNPAEDQWWEAAKRALQLLAPITHIDSLETLSQQILGEGQFGQDHWELDKKKKIYYIIKPFLPRFFIGILRRLYSTKQVKSVLSWPIEPRYAIFLWNTLQNLLILTSKQSVLFRSFWPNRKRFAFVLSHDVETDEGQVFVRKVADLDEHFGFRSIFNFIPERYDIDYNLIDELKARGFEIGLHGLLHDGKLFSSHKEFKRRALRINDYLIKFGANGFRSPLTHRHPEWMQSLKLDYDLSFFDTDPYEPMPGGTMSIWPFMIGNFMELPYTLAQDYTLAVVLGEKTPKIWFQKTDFLSKYHGMALVNTHPDYLKRKDIWNIYEDYLKAIQKRTDYWHALPCEVSQWWRNRTSESYSGPLSTAFLDQNNHLNISI